MKKKQAVQHKKIISVTVLMVLILGAMDIVSLLAEPVGAGDGLTVGLTVAVDLSRRLASVGSEVTEESPKNIVADFSCIEDSPKLEVEGGRLRIRSNSCQNFKTSDFTITNISNGYTASVFPIKNNEFTTDFMDLKYGENQVEIKMKNIAGIEATHSLVVHRRAPASASK